MLIKQEPITSHKLALGTFDELLSVLNKGKSAIPPLFSGPELLSSAELFVENVSKNCKLENPHFSLPILTSTTNLKMHISVTPKMVKKVITNHDFSKASFLILF